MFCGKTEELLRRIRRARIAKQTVLVVKPKLDNRFGDEKVVSRAGVEMKAETIALASHAISGYRPIYDVVAFDEAQFFGPDIIETINYLIHLDTRVIVSGLDQDFRQHPFGYMHSLLAMADEVTKLKAVCMKCHGEATTTQRLINGRAAPYTDDTILVGDSESYEARCRNCHEEGSTSTV